MYQNYIAGDWVGALAGETFASYNPANGELIGELPQCGPADVERAVAGAVDAFHQWRRVPAPKRGEIL
ncbi:MAG TPA: aldehyde dehydrogenase family protein, partial [Anaerolineae bacterium]